MRPEYIYKAKHENVINAQTVELTVDLGFNLQMTNHFELTNVDAHKVHGVDCIEQREMAAEETDFVKRWLHANETESDTTWPLTIQTHIPRDECLEGDYGVEIRSTETHVSLNADLISRFPRVIP